MTAIWLYLFTSFATAQECKKETRNSVPYANIADLTCAMAKEPLQEFMKRADPCVSKDLLSMEIDFPLCATGMGFMDSKSKPIPIEKLERLANEIVRPTRFNKMYQNHFNRPELAKFLIDLAKHMRKKSVKYIGCNELRAITVASYNEAKEKKLLVNAIKFTRSAASNTYLVQLQERSQYHLNSKKLLKSSL